MAAQFPSELLALLVCPETRQPLRVVDAETLARINARIDGGSIQDQSGRTIEVPLEGGLISEDGNRLYPIVDGIPVLLVDRAIRVSQLPGI